MAVFDILGNSSNVAYNIAGNAIETAYDINGGAIPLSGIAIDYGNYTIEQFYQKRQQQGSAYYGGYIFFFNAANSCDIVDIETWETYHAACNPSGHGNSASFSGEFYDENDEFPLLYLCSIVPSYFVDPSLPNTVPIYVYRITKTESGFSFSLIRTLQFPVETAGWYAQGAVDISTNTLYMLGFNEMVYDEGAFTPNSRIVFSVWDLDQLTENQDGTYTPDLISSHEKDYIIRVLQGMQFQNGKIFVASEDSHDIKIINPTTETVEAIIPVADTSEIEGMVFLTPYEMVIGYFNHDWMYKYTFST